MNSQHHQPMMSTAFRLRGFISPSTTSLIILFYLATLVLLASLYSKTGKCCFSDWEVRTFFLGSSETVLGKCGIRDWEVL